eukprot:164976_1
MKLKVLKNKCKKLKISAQGSKSECVERILNFYQPKIEQEKRERERKEKENIFFNSSEERTKLLIIGYLSSMKQRNLIPDAVVDIAYDYYYLFTDEWDEGSDLELNGKSVNYKPRMTYENDIREKRYAKQVVFMNGNCNMKRMGHLFFYGSE